MDGTHTLDLFRSREQCEALASLPRSGCLHAEADCIWWFSLKVFCVQPSSFLGIRTTLPPMLFRLSILCGSLIFFFSFFRLPQTQDRDLASDSGMAFRSLKSYLNYW